MNGTIQASNSPEEVRLRRLSSILSVSGLAVLFFGLWDIIKAVLVSVFVVPEMVKESISAMDAGTAAISYDLLYSMTVVIFLIIIAVSVAFRLIIGFSARAMAKGRKKGPAFQVLAVIMFAFSLAGVVLSLVYGSYGVSTADSVATLLVEITSAFATAELFLSAAGIRKLSR